MTDTGLIQRLEASTGADRELDVLVWADKNDVSLSWNENTLLAKFVDGYEDVLGWIDPGKHQRNFSLNSSREDEIPTYTSSVDACLSLLREEDPDADFDKTGRGITLHLYNPHRRYETAEHDLLTHAILIALLRAREAEVEG